MLKHVAHTYTFEIQLNKSVYLSIQLSNYALNIW